MEKEFWLICGPSPFTSVSRWEEHLAWLHEHPNMVGYQDHVRRAEDHISWLKSLGDPYPDHSRAGRTRASLRALEPELEHLERELGQQGKIAGGETAKPEPHRIVGAIEH